ncbi:MAG: hypothetical protein KKB20_10295 [Proteobacteria bacterium]|nr:hypothetical protein [Pseudomonadota bacterium]
MIPWFLVLAALAAVWPEGPARAAYPAGGRSLPAVSEGGLLARYDGPRPTLLESRPEFLAEFVKAQKAQGFWDQADRLRALVEPLKQDLGTRYELSFSPASEGVNLVTFLRLLAVCERLAQLDPPTLADEVWLAGGYGTLAFFTSSPFTDIWSEGFKHKADRAEGDVRAIFQGLDKLSRDASRAYFWTCNQVLDRKDLTSEAAVTILRSLAGRDDDPVLALQARRLMAVREPTAPIKNALIRDAVRRGYYDTAEAVWKTLTGKDRKDPSYAEAAEARGEAIRFEALAGKTDYESRLSRAGILMDFGRPGEAEPLYRTLLDENDRPIAAWTGLAKAVWEQNLKNASGPLNILDQAAGRTRAREADYYELRIGLSYVDAMRKASADGGSEALGRGLSRIGPLVDEYRAFRPVMAGLCGVWLEFMDLMFNSSGKGAEYGTVALKRLEELRLAHPQSPDVYAAWLPLFILVRGPERSIREMSAAMPAGLDEAARLRLRLCRAGGLIAAAWSRGEPVWLDRAATELEAVDDRGPAAERMRGDLLALRGILERKAEMGRRALEHYRLALDRARSPERPLLLNNVLFLALSLGGPGPAEAAYAAVRRLRVDGRKQAMLLPNQVRWVRESGGRISAGDVLSGLEAETGTSARAMALVLAGQLAGDEKERAGLWARARQEAGPCRPGPLYRPCYRPGPVLSSGAFDWQLKYASRSGLGNEVGLDWEFWLIHGAGRDASLGGWPSEKELRPAGDPAGSLKAGPTQNEN